MTSDEVVARNTSVNLTVFSMHAKKYLIDVRKKSIFMASNNNKTEIFSIRRSSFITGGKNKSMSINQHLGLILLGTEHYF